MPELNTLGPEVQELVGLKTTRTTVSSAELLDLVGNPIELVPAPGAGKAIAVLAATFLLKFGTTGYILPNGGDNGIYIPVSGFGDYVNMIALTSDAMQVFAPANQNIGGFPVENAPVRLEADGNPTGGDGSLVIDILYRVLDLPA